MSESHLIRVGKGKPYNTACGIDWKIKSGTFVTGNPKDVSCQSCVRCMTKKEVKKFLGE